MSASPPPARASLWQDLAWRVEAFGFDLLTWLFRLLPTDFASAMGGAALRAIGPFSRAHRTADRNLRIAFPQMDLAERKRLLSRQWDNVGRLFAEFPLMDRIRPATGRVEVIGIERLEKIAAEGKPVVFVSGHFSNWEVLAAAIVASGVPCQITYRAANNPYIDQRIIKTRERYGLHMFAAKGEAGSREIIQAMGRGESVALLNDQKFNNGVLAPFFGHLVHTAPGPTRLAMRVGGVIQTLSVRRTEGANFRVWAHEPIVLERTGDKAHDIEAGVRRITAFIEEQVRERPEEWFWVHRRWPNAVYESLGD